VPDAKLAPSPSRLCHDSAPSIWASAPPRGAPGQRRSPLSGRPLGTIACAPSVHPDGDAVRTLFILAAPPRCSLLVGSQLCAWTSLPRLSERGFTTISGPGYSATPETAQAAEKPYRDRRKTAPIVTSGPLRPQLSIPSATAHSTKRRRGRLRGMRRACRGQSTRSTRATRHRDSLQHVQSSCVKRRGLIETAAKLGACCYGPCCMDRLDGVLGSIAKNTALRVGVTPPRGIRGRRLGCEVPHGKAPPPS
jgi:hypothetical protein